MDGELLKVIDESIKLEENASELYHIFYEYFIEDSDFWWELHMEEKNHSLLLQSIRDVFIPYDNFPEKLFADSLSLIKEANSVLEETIESMRMNKPTRLVAFVTALKLEESAGEAHFQEFMESDFGSKFEDVIRRLNREDKNHYNRIDKYMKENL